jgi:hypothetical protein
VLGLTSYPALDVLIGLAFFYFLLSIVCSAVNEGIATALNLRGKTLEEGIRQLLGSPEAASAFFASWRVQALSKPGRFLHWVPGLGDKKPSYIPSRVFAMTVLDTFAPAAGGDQHDLLAKAQNLAQHAPEDRVRKILEDAALEVQHERDRMREALERQFDQSMERVSGWYKRRVQLFLFVISLVLAGAINADSFTVGQRLWKDDVLRTAVADQATKTVGSGAKCANAPKPGTTLTPAQKAGACLDQVKELNLPLGWTTASSPGNWKQGLAKAGGLLLTAFALLLGAPFWFDTLSKLAQLRGTGRASSDPSSTAGATTGSSKDKKK